MAKTFKLLQTFSQLAGRQGDKKVDIVIRGRSATAELAAFFTAVSYDKALFGIGLTFDRLKSAFTLAGSVSRVYVEVKRPKAMGTMVAR